jgi:hypothetical protein
MHLRSRLLERGAPLSHAAGPSREAARNKRLDLSKAGLEALKVRHPIGCGKAECEGQVAVCDVEVCSSERLRFGRKATGIGYALLRNFSFLDVRLCLRPQRAY